jgi:hypothetical protein
MSSNYPKSIGASLLILATSALLSVAIVAYTLYELHPAIVRIASGDTPSKNDSTGFNHDPPLFTVLEAQLRLKTDEEGKFEIFPVHKDQPMHVMLEYDKETVEGESYDVRVGRYSFVAKETGETIAGPFTLSHGTRFRVVAAPENGAVIIRATADRKAILGITVKQP